MSANRLNSNRIQLLGKELQRALFPPGRRSPKPSKELLELSRIHLEHNGLADKQTSQNTPISFELPKLAGPTIAHHFHQIGEWSQQPYLNLIDELAQLGKSPMKKPNKWLNVSGWTKYQPGKPPVQVEYPDDNSLVFDTEVLYKLSPYPVLATALGPDGWYGWVSPYLTGESATNDHLIPLGPPDSPKLIVGHNISYDRARVLEEYNLKQSKSFYLDTMSLHVAVSGMCSRQRGAWMKYRKNLTESNSKPPSENKSLSELRALATTPELRELLENDILDDESILNTTGTDLDYVSSALNEDPWLKHSSLSSLAHVAEHHCQIRLDKTDRDYFGSLDPQDIKDNFQTLMDYCANDVLATYHVFLKIWPEYQSVVPHPVSFSALRHITQSFLPTTSKWQNYIDKCEKMYQESKIEIEEKLHGICKEIVQLKDQEDKALWKTDPWLSQLDWEIAPIKYTKKGELFKRQKLPGYPNWYKKIAESNGDLNLTTKTRISALLLKLSWFDEPIIWTDIYGWCFKTDSTNYDKFVKKSYEVVDVDSLLPPEDLNIEDQLDSISENEANAVKIKEQKLDTPNSSKSKKKSSGTKKKTKKTKNAKKASTVKDVQFESDPIVIATLKSIQRENKILFKVPHENGPGNRVTSLMTKPFQRYFENEILSSSQEMAKKAISLSVQNSYWVSSRERIRGQFVVYKPNEQLSLESFQSEQAKQICPIDPPGEDQIGIIIPQIIPMGTITRRSVEKTWLTASNAKKNRLGSELKSLIRAPPGYCFVGADVDSEELWIASLMGDAVFGTHGGSALGWMTLEGTKNEGTDLHSKTAQILGISRGEAKVFNYGRIYGAGKKFATTLLKKFNPEIGEKEAASTANNLYTATKGISGAINKVRVWYGGSESVVFNRLEQIAEQDYPRTPVLGAGITQALQKSNLNANSFLPSRINWAIQSSGVDYLHLLLVSMEFLCKYYSIDARLCITVHDEVRFMTKWEDRYKCAMALQIANLWTRAMFCYQVGIDDVPQSCAFFSAVDIDWVLRKEVDFECVTPSSTDKLPSGESMDINQLLELDDVKQMLSLKPLDEFWKTKDSYDEIGQVIQLAEPKLSKPVENLDKFLDSKSNALWVKLQICQNEKEFKAIKKKFLDEVQIGQRKAFSKKIRHENLDEDVITNIQLKVTDLPEDIGEVAHKQGVFNLIDQALEENEAEKKRYGSKRKYTTKSSTVGNYDGDFNIELLKLNQITSGTNVRFAADVVSKSQQKRQNKLKNTIKPLSFNSYTTKISNSSSISDFSDSISFDFIERDASIERMELENSNESFKSGGTIQDM